DSPENRAHLRVDSEWPDPAGIQEPRARIFRLGVRGCGRDDAAAEWPVVAHCATRIGGPAKTRRARVLSPAYRRCEAPARRAAARKPAACVPAVDTGFM